MTIEILLFASVFFNLYLLKQVWSADEMLAERNKTIAYWREQYRQSNRRW